MRRPRQYCYTCPIPRHCNRSCRCCRPQWSSCERDSCLAGRWPSRRWNPRRWRLNRWHPYRARCCRRRYASAIHSFDLLSHRRDRSHCCGKPGRLRRRQSFQTIRQRCPGRSPSSTTRGWRWPTRRCGIHRLKDRWRFRWHCRLQPTCCCQRPRNTAK